MRPTPALTVAAALLAACSAGAVRPPDAREVAYFRAAQAQAVRIAAMTDEEVARELALAEGEQAAERPRAEFGDLDHWLELLRCRERPTVAARADCYAGAARLHEAAERLLREQTKARYAVRT